MANILIVGGGVAGLSAGIYASLGGHKATVCERHTVPGGNLTGWQRGEYHIDNCIHWLTGTNPASATYKMWRELGVLGNIPIRQGESLYTVEHDGESLSLYSDLERTEREMLDVSRKDAKETRSLIRTVRAMQSILGIGGERKDGRFGTLKSLACAPLLMKYYALSTGELAERFKSHLLKKFIISFFGKDFGSLAVIMVFAHYCGANGGIPEGGSLAMARRMADRFESLGGELMLGKAVSRISLSGTRADAVIFEDGERREADYIVIAADPASVFGKLTDIPMPRALAAQHESSRFMRFSSYHCAFSSATDKLPFNGDLIFDVPEEYRSVLGTKRLIIREFSHEPSFAPSGKTVIQSLVFCDEESSLGFIKLSKDKREYKRMKDKLALTVEYLITNRFPELRGKIKLLDIWTPASYKRFTCGEAGAYMAYALPKRYLPFRLPNTVRGVGNLILATQWLQLPGGLPTAAYAGRAAIDTIVAKEAGKERKTKSVPAFG